MPSYICTTCGVGYAPSEAPPQRCEICADERQYVSPRGQAWTTLGELKQDHANDIRELGPGLWGIGATPQIAIGQRALFIPQEGGGILWDCTPLITEAAIAHLKAHGGLRAIAISHPHFYSSMVDWSDAFGGIPIHIHEANRQYVMRSSPHIRYFTEERIELGQGITVTRAGGHYVGSAALHWPGLDGKGVLMTGDTIMVVPDTRWVSFMYSFPNLIPLPAREVRRIVATVDDLGYDRIYSAWWERVMTSDARARVRASADRYVAAIS